MTDRIVEHDALAHAERTVARAYKALEAAVEVLESTVDAARIAAHPDETGVVKEVKVVNLAFLNAMQMQGKVHEAGSQIHRAGRHAELDLGAARAEIEFRLACLRAAGGGGTVPDEPE